MGDHPKVVSTGEGGSTVSAFSVGVSLPPWVVDLEVPVPLRNDAAQGLGHPSAGNWVELHS